MSKKEEKFLCREVPPLKRPSDGYPGDYEYVAVISGDSSKIQKRFYSGGCDTCGYGASLADDVWYENDEVWSGPTVELLAMARNKSCIEFGSRTLNVKDDDYDELNRLYESIHLEHEMGGLTGV